MGSCGVTVEVSVLTLFMVKMRRSPPSHEQKPGATPDIGRVSGSRITGSDCCVMLKDWDRPTSPN